MNPKNQILRRRIFLAGGVVLVILLAVFGFRKYLFADTQGASAKAPMSAVVSLSVDKESFAESDDVIVHVAITNPNDFPIRILKWFTPLNGVERSLFTVTRNGEPVPYIGKMVKRAAPTEADYITLEPGASVTSDVNLAEVYALSVSDHYQVAYDVTSLQLYVEYEIVQLNNGRLTSNTVTMFVKGRTAPVH